MKPLILINFKTYKEAIGGKALNLARQISKVKKHKYHLAIAPSLLMIGEVSKKTNISVYSQHADAVTTGAHTGSISVTELKEMGVEGVILNHSERKISLKVLKETIRLCKRNKLKTVICASNLSEAKKVAQLKPNYLAYEPKELIGGNISVTKAKPKLIVKVVLLVKRISPRTKVLCGAGIHNKEDIKHALLLGTEGVLIGHAVPKAKNPKKFLEKMLV